MEAERDALAANLSDLQRRSVAVALPPHVSPEHLWATVDLSDLLDETGRVSHERFEAAVEQTIERFDLRPGQLRVSTNGNRGPTPAAGAGLSGVAAAISGLA